MTKLRVAFLLMLLVALTSSVLRAQKPDGPVAPQGKQKIVPATDFVDCLTVVEEVSFTGFDSEPGTDDYSAERRLFESDARMVVRENNGEIKPGEAFSSEKIERTILSLKKFLSERGYFSAHVTALGQKLSSDRMKLIFAVERGPVVGVSRVQFTGNLNFTSEELTGELMSCMGNSWGRYDPRYLEYCAQMNVRSLMYSRGYLTAKISNPFHSYRNGGIEIRFDVDEGVRYRWGEFRIDGSKLFSDKQILGICGLTTGEIANGRAFQELVYERMERLYKDKGYIQYNAEFEPEFIPPPAAGLDGVVNVQIQIDEGRAFKVRRIKFEGVPVDREKALLGEMSLKAGESFIQSKLESDVDHLNELDEFQHIDKDQDVQILADDKAANVDLVISLRPRNP